jgi:hypothetical protein
MARVAERMKAMRETVGRERIARQGCRAFGGRSRLGNHSPPAVIKVLTVSNAKSMPRRSRSLEMRPRGPSSS